MDIFLTIAALGFAMAQPDDDDDEARKVLEFDAFEVRGSMVRPAAADLGKMGATPGGAQDVSFLRDRVAAGEVPLPEVFTAEGLFSEHDLPLAGTGTCERLLCVNARAVDAALGVQPDVRWLVQLGFESGLTEATFRRAPLNLVAVVDKSGSMSGEPIETVKASLREVAAALGPQDQLSIVLYGSRVHTHLGPTRGGDPRILAAIDAIAIEGSTNLEAGLAHGFELARQTRRRFDGTTRVMLFTDERPNTGRTDAGAFMSLAGAGSRDGIGMTTVGVGVQFGAELAQRVSSVRGGNLVFFASPAEMRQRFARDFDTWVTELAYDLDVEVRPADGLRIAGVYGVPGEAVRWTEGGGIALHVATLFLSRDEGALYVALAPEDDGRPARAVGLGDRVATVDLGYQPRDGSRVASTSPVAVGTPGAGDEGLTRGVLLVDEVTTLKRAAALHHRENDQDGAWQLVHALRRRLEAVPDPALRPEVQLVASLEATLARLAGRAGEAPVVHDAVTGLPVRH